MWRCGILFAETRISVFFLPFTCCFFVLSPPPKNIFYYPSVASFITLRYSIYTFCILFYTDYCYFALLALSFHTIIYIYLSLVLGLGSSEPSFFILFFSRLSYYGYPLLLLSPYPLISYMSYFLIHLRQSYLSIPLFLFFYCFIFLILCINFFISYFLPFSLYLATEIYQIRSSPIQNLGKIYVTITNPKKKK